MGDSLSTKKSESTKTTADIQIIPDEAIAEFTKIVNAVRRVEQDDPDHNEDGSVQQGAPSPNSTGDTTPTPSGLSNTGTVKTPQKLTKKRPDYTPGGGFLTLSAFLSRSTSNKASKTPTTESDTPQVEDSITESSDVSEDPLTLPLLEGASYYVFNPRSPGSAYYLHGSDGDEVDLETEFQVSKVPVTLTMQETGEPAYMLSMSNRDCFSSRRKSQETLWPTNDTGELPTRLHDVTSSIEGGGESPHVSKGVSCGLGVEKQSPVAGDGIEWIGLEIFPSIMAKVNHRLRNQRHLRDHVHVIDDQGKHAPGTNNMFLIRNKDIRDVVSIVVDEMREFQNASWAGDSIHKKPRAQSMLKLDGVSNTILPPPVVAADPATTFSLPKTSYASLYAKDSRVHTKVRGVESETTTTIVSRKSTAEITWPHNHAHVHHFDVYHASTHSRTVSECTSPTHRASTVQSSDRRQSQPAGTGSFILNHYTTSENGSDIPWDNTSRQGSRRNERTSSATGITSFPRLLSRHCTNDWVTPLDEIDAPTELAPDTLYHHGVDARSGSVSGPPSKSPEGPLRIRHCDNDMFVKNPFCLNSEQLDTVCVIQMPEVPASQKRFGASIGSASHRRRSSPAAAPQTPTSDSHNTLLPSLMEKIRQGSHKIFHRRHSQRGSEEVGALPSPEEHRPISKPQSRDSLVRHLTLEPPNLDRAGIYEAMTGTRLVVSRCRRGTCSEDNRPHTCENNMSTPPRAESPA